MELLAANSIFRCVPSMLPLHFRRLLGAFAYAIDGAELAYCRLREAALDYEMPQRGARSSLDRWTARNRLSILNDAWALIDHVSRARKLISRFPWDQSKSPRDLNQFIRETKPAGLVRNRLHHLDEDVYSRADCTEGHPILGRVSWVDSRNPQKPIRFTITSGTGDEAEQGPVSVPHSSGAQGDVGEFTLCVCEEEADLDALHETMLWFAKRLEAAVSTSVRELVDAEAKRRKVPVEQLCESHFVDLTIATPVQSKPGREHRLFEVPPDAYDPQPRNLASSTPAAS